MSRKYLNNRWCIRCGRKSPCPYLAKNIGLFNAIKSKPVVDCGCGNGRNTIYLNSIGFSSIYPLDMAGDFGLKTVLGKDIIPLENKSVGLILCNYIFMFRDKYERDFLGREINRVAGNGCYLMVELYPAKDSYFKNEEDILKLQKLLYNKLKETGWSKIRYSKQKFILQKG